MKKKKLLLHSCCAPCSTAVIERLSDEYDITILYYNPNIYPEEEYLKRKAEEIKYLKILKEKSNIVVKMLDSDYESEKFYNAVKGLEKEREGGARCAVCFKLRLEETCMRAKAEGYEIFGTTLTVSPHKDSNIINMIGKNLESKYNVMFLESNFKKQNGYKRSIELSKENNLYRQNYCGCEFALNQQKIEAPESLNKVY